MAATNRGIAKTINSIMHLSSEDQERMLEVIGDFFSYPSSSAHDSEDNTDDEEMEIDLGTCDAMVFGFLKHTYF